MFSVTSFSALLICFCQVRPGSARRHQETINTKSSPNPCPSIHCLSFLAHRTCKNHWLRQFWLVPTSNFLRLRQFHKSENYILQVTAILAGSDYQIPYLGYGDFTKLRPTKSVGYGNSGRLRPPKFHNHWFWIGFEYKINTQINKSLRTAGRRRETIIINCD